VPWGPELGSHMSHTEIAVQAPPVTKVARIKDYIFSGAFVLTSVAAMFGWVAALGWGAFRLASWLF